MTDPRVAALYHTDGAPKSTPCGHILGRARVSHRRHNHSAFNGRHYTPSPRSEIVCGEPGCHNRWRTYAAYVDFLPGECASAGT